MQNGVERRWNKKPVTVKYHLKAQSAERSIVTQYYMIHNDTVGSLFIDQLYQAADRGVRVRLLIDDIDMGGRDFGTAKFDSHPNIVYIRKANF